MQKITAVILTFNGEEHLDKTLASLDFCDRLLVVDSGSTDKTLEIAQKHGADILLRDWEGTIPQFKFAFKHVDTPWIVTLDQDEHLSPELKTNITSALENPGEAAGFYCPRSSFYFNRFIRHGGWYPDYLLRVFRLDSVEIRGVLPHEEFHPTGRTARLTGDIIHYPYRDLSEHMAKINNYTRTSAQELYKKGKRAGIAKALAHGFGKSFKQYVLKRGFLDGRAGLILAVHAFIYSFQKYARLAEMSEKNKNR